MPHQGGMRHTKGAGGLRQKPRKGSPVALESRMMKSPPTHLPRIVSNLLAYLHIISTKSSSASSHRFSDLAASCQLAQPCAAEKFWKSPSHLATLPGLARIGRTPYADDPRGCSDHHSESLQYVARSANLSLDILITLPPHAHFFLRNCFNQQSHPASRALSSAVLVARRIHVR